MKKPRFNRWVLGVTSLLLAGCSQVDSPVADVGLAGAGGVVGYQLSDGSPGWTAAGAATGLVISRVTQAQIQEAIKAADRAGYDRAMNQAVKQQYWIIQNQQKRPESEGVPEARMTAVVIPEANINGVIQKAHIEYVRVKP